MNILGIGCYYHDSSAALLADGRVVAAAQEERFSRKKHDSSFPLAAIKYCLDSQSIGIQDIDYVAFYEKPFLKLERALSQHLQMFPRSLKTFLSSLPSWITEKSRVPRTFTKLLGYRGDVLFVPHHLSHAAGSFFASPFQEAAILTVDGVGEWTTTAYGRGKGNEIKLLREIRFPHSLGLLYSTLTAYLGFSVNNSEYKVMGLSPHGLLDRKDNPYYEKLRQVIDIKDDGSYRLDMDYFVYHYASRMPSPKLCRLLGGPVRKPEAALEQRHKDIAAALQMVTEDVLTKILCYVYKETRCENLVLSGGTALNSVYNGKILSQTPFKKIWIQPDPGDGGAGLGAALFVYHGLFNYPRREPFESAYLGPEFSREQIKDYLDKEKICYTEFSTDQDLITSVAGQILQNQVVGWFWGRMEWGPRALGARSILSNPCNPQMREILNLKVKHREKFRPFAPVVCAEDAAIYFDCDNPLPLPTDYMLMVYPIKAGWRRKIPAVTHVDGSGRLQTVSREQNPRYYDLIKEFGRRSGIPILINTSFNIRGEPIVCTPRDAYRCMMGTGIDALVMDRFLIRRQDNPQDIWDSEKLARD